MGGNTIQNFDLGALLPYLLAGTCLLGGRMHTVYIRSPDFSLIFDALNFYKTKVNKNLKVLNQ